MFLQENLPAVILCATAIVSSCVALTAWVRREMTPSTKPFIRLMVAITAYATAAACSEIAQTVTTRRLWVCLEYVASNSVIAFYLIFALCFAGLKGWTTPRRRSLIWTVPVLNVLIVLSDRWHGLVWQGIELQPIRSALSVVPHGAGYYWIASCFYVYVVTGSVLVIRSALAASHLHQRQSITIVAGAFPPVVAGTVFALKIAPGQINILPMSFLLTGSIYFASLFKFRLLDLLPVARDTLIERMNDGVLVVNSDNCVLDLNPAARRYARQSEICTGRHVDYVLADWPEIAAYCQQSDNQQSDNQQSDNQQLENLTDLTVERPDIPLYVEVSITHLRRKHSHITGKILVIRDITQKHHNQLEIQHTNRELNQQLSQIKKLRDQLKEQAIRDGLTGLFNRRYFDEALPAELEKAARSDTPLSVVLMDIDYFKKVNDTYGHLAGDLALRTFAEVMGQHIRKSDIACRYGGEEFILAMPNMSLTEAQQRADTIRRSLKATQMTFDGQSFQVTVSMGLGTFPHTHTCQSALLKQVDQALYVAKANGRDRIEIASQKVAVISKLSELESAIAHSRMQV